MKEEWLPVKGFEGLYEVSNLGRVRSYVQSYDTREVDNLATEYKLMKGSNDRGYRVVELSKNGRRFTKQVHRLVAEVFVENEYSKPYVNHIDGVKDNNFFENLEWCTQEENMRHAWDMGLITPPPLNSGPSKAVDMFSLDGKYIKTYPSQAEAVREHNMKHNKISYVCNGKRKQAGGYMWRHSKDIGEVKHDIDPVKYSREHKIKKGVYSKEDKWIANITINKKRHYLGIYDVYEDAVKARIQAEREILK